MLPTQHVRLMMEQPEETYPEMRRLFYNRVRPRIEDHFLTVHSGEASATELQEEMKQSMADYAATAPVSLHYDNVDLSLTTPMEPLATWKTADGVVYAIRVNQEERRWRLHMVGPMEKLKPLSDAVYNAWSHFYPNNPRSPIWDPAELVKLIKQATELNMWSRRAYPYALLADQAYQFPADTTTLPATWQLVQQFPVKGGNLFTVCYSSPRNEAALLIKGTNNRRNYLTDLWFTLTSCCGSEYTVCGKVCCCCGTRFPGLREALEIGRALQNARIGMPIERSKTVGEDFVEKLGKLQINHITIVGHSLGGLITEMVAIKLGLPGESFDSPGCRDSSIMSEEEYQTALAEGRVRVNCYFSEPHVINTVNPHPGEVLWQLSVPDKFTADRTEQDRRQLRPRRNPLARVRLTYRYLRCGLQWTLARHSMTAIADYLSGLPAERTEHSTWPTLNRKNAVYLLIGKHQRDRCPYEDDLSFEKGTVLAPGDAQPTSTECVPLLPTPTGSFKNDKRPTVITLLEWLLKHLKLEDDLLESVPHVEPILPPASPIQSHKELDCRSEIVKGFVNYLILARALDLPTPSDPENLLTIPSPGEPSIITMRRFVAYVVSELTGGLPGAQPILAPSRNRDERAYQFEMITALQDLLLEMEQDMTTAEERQTIEFTRVINPGSICCFNCTRRGVAKKHQEMLHQLLGYMELERAQALKAKEGPSEMMMWGFIGIVLFDMGADLPRTPDNIRVTLFKSPEQGIQNEVVIQRRTTNGEHQCRIAF
ncbi:hypothetical protein BV898_14541 [Hypsibius exemplaris]|uniref:Fungal lipase-like domain-containing protein n=1 Tax=Hypsibius exemplaris TaxID=2072580 RepID=A0A9X6N8T8_HYPEX|nr:hypothetical protein BV898_14541 [Hypsibius exemplaris]